MQAIPEDQNVGMMVPPWCHLGATFLQRWHRLCCHLYSSVENLWCHLLSYSTKKYWGELEAGVNGEGRNREKLAKVAPQSQQTLIPLGLVDGATFLQRWHQWS